MLYEFSRKEVMANAWFSCIPEEGVRIEYVYGGVVRMRERGSEGGQEPIRAAVVARGESQSMSPVLQSASV